MSSNVSTLTEILGRNVVAIADAEDVGQVKAVVLDRSARRIERLQVAGRKRSAELVDWSQVDSVGSDAVMIRSTEDVHSSRDDDDDAPYVRGDIPIIGARVLDTDGFELGTLTDLHFDSGTGEVTAAMTDASGRITADRIRSLGTFALIVEPTA